MGDGEGGVVWITDFAQNWYIEGVVVTNLAYACDFLQVKIFFFTYITFSFTNTSVKRMVASLFAEACVVSDNKRLRRR